MRRRRRRRQRRRRRFPGKRAVAVARPALGDDALSPASPLARGRDARSETSSEKPPSPAVSAGPCRCRRLRRRSPGVPAAALEGRGRRSRRRARPGRDRAAPGLGAPRLPRRRRRGLLDEGFRLFFISSRGSRRRCALGSIFRRRERGAEGDGRCRRRRRRKREVPAALFFLSCFPRLVRPRRRPRRRHRRGQPREGRKRARADDSRGGARRAGQGRLRALPRGARGLGRG